MNFFRHHIKYLFILIFPAVCILLYNSAVNIHSHQLNGNIITHAHPYTHHPESPVSPIQNHKHTSFEFFVLNKVFLLFLTLVACIAAFQLILSFNKKQRYIQPISPKRYLYFSTKNPRAPPIMF